MMHPEIGSPPLPGSWDPWVYDPQIEGGRLYCPTLERFLAYAASENTVAIIASSLSTTGKQATLTAYGPAADFPDGQGEQRLYVTFTVSRFESSIRFLSSEVRDAFSTALKTRVHSIHPLEQRLSSGVSGGRVIELLNLPKVVT